MLSTAGKANSILLMSTKYRYFSSPVSNKQSNFTKFCCVYFLCIGVKLTYKLGDFTIGNSDVKFYAFFLQYYVICYMRKFK